MTAQFLLLFLYPKVQGDRKMKSHNTESIYCTYWWLPSSCPSSELKSPSKKYISRLGFGIASPAFTLAMVSSPWIISPNVTNYFVNPTPSYLHHGTLKLFCNQESGNTLHIHRLASHDATEKQGWCDNALLPHTRSSIHG